MRAAGYIRRRRPTALRRRALSAATRPPLRRLHMRHLLVRRTTFVSSRSQSHCCQTKSRAHWTRLNLTQGQFVRIILALFFADQIQYCDHRDLLCRVTWSSAATFPSSPSPHALLPIPVRDAFDAHQLHGIAAEAGLCASSAASPAASLSSAAPIASSSASCERAKDASPAPPAPFHALGKCGMAKPGAAQRELSGSTSSLQAADPQPPSPPPTAADALATGDNAFNSPTQLLQHGDDASPLKGTGDGPSTATSCLWAARPRARPYAPLAARLLLT